MAIIKLVDRKWTQKSTLLAIFTPVFWPFLGSKKSISGLLKVFLELFRKCSSINLGLKRHTFGCIFSSKVDKWIPKSNYLINNLLILAIFRDHFWPFWWSKKQFSYRSVSFKKIFFYFTQKQHLIHAYLLPREQGWNIDFVPLRQFSSSKFASGLPLDRRLLSDNIEGCNRATMGVGSRVYKEPSWTWNNLTASLHDDDYCMTINLEVWPKKSKYDKKQNQCLLLT